MRSDVGPARGPRRARAPAGPRGRQGRRRDRGALARRRRRARAGARRIAGAGRRPSSARSRSSCSTSSTRCRGRWPTDEPDGLDEILAAADPAPAAPRRRRRRGAVAGAWLGRAAGCVLGKPVEGLPREGIRAIARGDGQLAGRRLVHGRGPPGRRLRALAVEPREPADEPRREHRRDPGGRRPQLHDARASSCSSAAGRGSTRSTSRSSGSTTSRRAGSSPPSASPCGTCSRRYLPPETATRRNPFREWIGARLRVDAYGWAAAGRPRRRGADGVGGRPAQPHGQRRLRRDVHGRRARRVADGVVVGRVRRRRASPSCRRGAGSRRRCATHATSPARGDWEAVVDGLYERLGALPLGARDQQHGARRGRAVRLRRRLLGRRSARAVQGGWDTDTNGAAVGSILGATVGTAGIEQRWSEPLHGRFASSLPGFDGIGSTSSYGARSR